MMSGQQLARVGDDLVARRVAPRDRVHLVVELVRHLRVRDALGVLLERADDRLALHRGLDRVVRRVPAVVERLDDVVPGRLRPQAELLHLLDELALAVARRRLGLLLVHAGAAARPPCAPSASGGSTSSFFSPNL